MNSWEPFGVVLAQLPVELRLKFHNVTLMENRAQCPLGYL